MWSSLPPFPPRNDLPLENCSPPSTPSETVSSACDTLSFDHVFSSLNLNDQTTVSNTDLAPEKQYVNDFSDSRNSEKSSKVCIAPTLHDATVSSAGIDPYSTADNSNLFNDLSLDGNVDFHNPRIERKTNDSLSNDVTESDRLPPPEELGCGHPFLLFVCLAVLLQERDRILSDQMEYEVMVMHFDKMVRKHSPKKVLSRAMKLFAEYLRSDSSPSST